MVYLIHFDKPYKHANHYIGFTVHDDPNLRLNHHKNGSGSRLLNALNKVGITYSIVRTWIEGDRTFERLLKNRKKSKHLCPICNKNHNKNANNINKTKPLIQQES